MTRSQQARAHEMDTERWSASKAARKAVRLRNSVVNNLTRNPVIAETFATEFQSLHEQKTEIYRRSGYGSLVAAQLASSGLQTPHNPAVDPHAFIKMGIERRDEYADTVLGADTFITSPNFYATVAAAADTLDESDVRFLYEKDFQFGEEISRKGFILFPEIQHFCVDEEVNAVEELIAITWRIATDPNTGDKTVKVTTWTDCNGPMEFEGFTLMRENAAREGHPYPDIVPSSYASAPLELGGEFELEVDATDLEARAVKLPATDAIGEFTGDAIRGQLLPVWSIKFVMAFTRLARQKRNVVEKFAKGLPKKGPGAPRPDKPQPHYDVRVVTLNQAVERGMDVGRDHEPKDSTGRQYKNRFVVGIHKVRQWYPSRGQHEVIFRGPFIKGPDGAPLLVRPVAWALK
jgi:hypothetical protein